ncbi:hypothetical protein CP533_0402 [Ophiocordyceps camponoti-saundersi (nom. inval.)]|nr:hypothetical protein CP533_0402 [Ophiocordyceps camponoti-saundersi (nom. inval.)]
MNGSKPAEGQKPPLTSETSSNGSGSLVAKKRKKDVKPIITTEGAGGKEDHKPGRWQRGSTDGHEGSLRGRQVGSAVPRVPPPPPEAVAAQSLYLQRYHSHCLHLPASEWKLARSLGGN